jgi:hypothetical protein
MLFQGYSGGGGSGGGGGAVSSVFGRTGAVTAQAGDYSAFYTSLVEESNILYVGKHGNDSNDGKTIGKAFLTIGAAITAASGETPASDNRFKIEIIDAGNYTENLTIPEWVGVIGLAALINGQHTVADNTALWAFRLLSSTGTCVAKSAGTGNALVRAGRMILTNGSNGTLVTSGELIFECGVVEVENGFGFGSTSTGQQQIIADQIDITGTGIGAGVSGAGSMCVRVNCINDTGSGTGILTASGATINAIVNSINCTTAVNEGTGTTLNLICASVTGTETRAGSGKTVKVNNVALLDDAIFTAFPVTPSSAPTSDYQVSNKKYVDDTVLPVSEAVTKTGSNCLTLNGSNNYISVSPNTDFEFGTGDFSLFLNVKFDTIKTGRNNFIDQSGNNQRALQFEYDSTENRIRLGLPEDKASGSSWDYADFTYTMATDTDYYIVAYRESGTTYLYINGSLVGSTEGLNGTNQDTGSTAPIAIGALYVDASNTFYHIDGKIFGVGVTKGALSTTDKTAIQQGNVPSADNLSLYLPLAEGSGIVAYDTSGNDNHGTIEGTLTNVWDNTQDEFHYNNDYGCSKAMKFNGTNNYISVTDNAFNVSDVSATPFEIRFSVNLTEDVLDGSLTSLVTIGTTDYNTLHIGVESTNKIRVIYSIDGVAWTIHLASTSLSSGWNDIVITRDVSGNYLVTSNGVTYLDFTDANDILLNNYEMHIGAHYSLSAAYYFHDELFNFDFKVNDVSVAKYSGTETDSWTDLSGNSNDGTVNGTATSLIYIPALTDLSENAVGGEIQNPAERGGTESNGSETTVDLVVTMEADAYDFQKITVSSATDYFKINQGTTVQRLALTGMSGGEEYYDTDIEAKFLYNATLSAWVEV